MDLEIIDDFLSHSDCDFLINYFKKSQETTKWNDTTFLQLEHTPITKIKVSWIRYWFRRRIEKKISIKLNYDQIVRWNIMSHKDMHRDNSYDRSNDWTVVCYLNDDYEGGELTVEGEVIPQKVGSLIQIPQPEGDINARPKHGVSEVTKGTRYSLVFWNFV